MKEELIKSEEFKKALKELAKLIKEYDTVRDISEEEDPIKIAIEQITSKKAISLVESWIRTIFEVEVPETDEFKEDKIIERLK